MVDWCPTGYRLPAKGYRLRADGYRLLLWVEHGEEKGRTFRASFDLYGYPHEEEVILPPDGLIRNYRAERARLDAEIDERLAKICEILGIEVE